MMAESRNVTGERLTLQSRMSDAARLASWIEGLATRHKIPASMVFAMNLCLEEVIANIIRHGYSGEAGHPITIQFVSPFEEHFVFVVEDEAPPFNPVNAPELPAFRSFDDDRIGGQGIRLLRRFADSLDYKTMPEGNQLTIGFSTVKSVLAKD